MHDGSFLPGLAGVQRGVITAIGPDGRAQVSMPSHGTDLLWARSLVPTPSASIGHEVALVMMAEADPLILGLMVFTKE